MRIKIWSSHDPRLPDVGPFKALDIVQKDVLYTVGDTTHYGTVITIAPYFPPFDEGVDQSVIVRLDPVSLASSPQESVLEKQPSSYAKIAIAPIRVDRFMFPHVRVDRFMFPHEPLDRSCSILEGQNLSIEDVSGLLTSETFSVWKHDCYLSAETIDALQGMKYAVVHRYSTNEYNNANLDARSEELVNLAVACLQLIRPTRRSRAARIIGVINADGTLDPRGLGNQEPVEVPEVQKLFSVKNQDVNLIRSIFPVFAGIYQKDDMGRLMDDYEPIRMAVQLYEQAYAIQYWKARHILWWAAIEALYGNAEDAVMARIYSFFGHKNLIAGFDHSIYEEGDIPSCYHLASHNNHTIGEMLPRIYDVRNASAHGAKVPDPHFTLVPHPLGSSVPLLEVLAEAATFIIRKTIIEIFRRGLWENFRSRQSSETFWLEKYGLNSSQSKKRLGELKLSRPIGGRNQRSSVRT